MERTIFIVDDEPTFRALVDATLSRDYHTKLFAEANSLLKCLEREEPDLILTDYSMPDMDGIELIERVKAKRPHIPIIMLTNYGSVDAAVRALKAGAFHFLEKTTAGGVSSANFTILKELIARALETSTYKHEAESLREELKKLKSIEIIGESAPIKAVKQTLLRLATLDSTVLLIGETGTGKNLAAEFIHQSSRRSSGKFIEINCAALPETLLEAELFGYEKGAFTDAKTSRKGLFELAHNGTIFLDEIDAASPSVQAKLLSVLETKRIRRIGGNDVIPIDARLICATNANLPKKVAEKEFREDLFYRIAVMTVEMPPLRSLGNDVILLAEHFAERFAREMDKVVGGLTHEAKEKLLSHSWRGNVRELRNVIERAIAFTPETEPIIAENLVFPTRHAAPSHAPADDSTHFTIPIGKTLEEIKIAYVQEILRRHGDNFTKASSILGISQKSLWELRKKYELT
ncbi:MAG: sigma-54 dependent transcriptional regulator [Chloroherpetonaceae bacterium]|nr:sigma-54 dependent transcriptional regulator [Chloroherpetonaceae bacterium]MDW8437796.1 sigma-54 dependent transcriptional regulator [Chloroherpetonaceae bacterium]